MNLDSLAEMEKLDSKGVLSSIRLMPEQIEQAWQEIHQQKAPERCSTARQVVIAGMGGSALGGRIIQSLFFGRMRTPIEVVTGYSLPNYVGPDTLVILSSYSGGTEETLASAHEAESKRAQIFGITTGGALGEYLTERGLPSYIFEPKQNPSGQPRLALGYSVAAIAGLLSQCSFISLSDDEMSEAIRSLRKVSVDYGPTNPQHLNLAKKVAQEMFKKVPVLIASEHLVGATHAVKNMLNENSKTFSVIFDIPELNHHLMEGLRNPSLVKEHLAFLFIQSPLYHERVTARYPVTKDVVSKNEVLPLSISLKGESKLSDVFEVLSFGAYVSFYSSMLYGIDPAPIPWVDYFKESLAKGGY